MPDRPYDLLAPKLWPKGDRPNVWAVLDGARDEMVWSTLHAFTLQHQCLYAGTLHPALERAAPYLVQLEFDHPHTVRLVNRSWGKSWGIFLRANSSMTALRRHLRQFLRVTGPNGKPLVFRYYDPRVMRIFLPTCSARQLDELFGSIECIGAEDLDGAALLEFGLDRARQRLVSQAVALGQKS